MLPLAAPRPALRLVFALCTILTAVTLGASLATSPTWTFTSDQALSQLGYSIAVADVNGDGYADVVSGALRYQPGGLNQAGRVQAFYGSASGLSDVPNWTIDATNADDFLGITAANAGDVNGDGYPDILVGAVGWDNGALTNAGQVRLYAGGANGLSTTPLWTAASDQAYAIMGSVGTIGDLNGDGYADVAVGAQGYDNPDNFEGRVTVYYGGPAGPSSAPDWMQEGNVSNAAYAPVAGGDVNGDGYADLIVGASGHGDGGRIFVYAGSSSGLSTTPMATLSGSTGDGYGGWLVAADVNGDGYADIATGNDRYGYSQWSGRTWLHYGTASGPSPSAGWTTNGFGDDQYGTLHPVGDVNNDGYDDLMVGSMGYGDGRGAVYLYVGSASGLSTGPLWTAIGPPSSSFGQAFGAGDFNGDNKVDVAVGSQWTSQVLAYYDCTAPSAPASAAVTAEGVLSWTAPTSGGAVDHYDVYLADGSCMDGVKIAEVAAGTTTYTNPSHNESAYYTVVAVGVDGCASGPSNCAHDWSSSCPPPVIVTSPDALCPNGTSGQATTEGSYANYSWAIQNGELLSPPDYPSVAFRATSYDQPVTLSVIVTDQAGCQSYASKQVPLRSIAPPVIVHTPASLCPNGASGQASTEGAYSHYAWAIQNGELLSPPDYPSVAFRAISYDQPVTLSVIVTDQGGCQSYASKQVPLRSIAPPVIVHTPAALCPNGANGQASTEGAYSHYAWAIQNGELLSPPDYPSVAFRATSYDQPVTLSVIVTDQGGCQSYASKQVPLRSIAPPVIVHTPQSLCPNGASGEATTEGAYSVYSWAIQNGELLSPPDNPSVSFRATSYDQPVTLSVIVTDQGGCQSYASKQVPLRSIAPPVIVHTPESLCTNGASGQATTEGTYGMYSWAIQNGEILGATNTPTVSFRATTSEPVTLSVIVTDQGGCSSSASKQIPIRTLAPPTIDVAPASVCPNGASATASVAGTYASYAWSVLNGQIVGTSNQSTVSFYATSSSPVQVSVTVTDGGGCASSASKSVPIATIAEPTITASGPTSFCEGGSVVLSAPAGYSSYLWSNGATTESIVVTQSGNYSVTVTNSAGCSAQSAGTPVAVSPIPNAPTIAADGPATFCDGGSVTLTAEPAGYRYLWSNGAEMPSITVTASGTYTVTIFGAGDCSATSAPFTVTELAPLTRPTITANGPTTFCEGGSVEVVANVSGGSGDYNYQWFSTGRPIPGATSQTYIATGNPSYVYVQVTDSVGCVSMTSEAKVFTVKPLPDATITAEPAVCANATQGASAPWAGNGSTYHWTISGGTITGTMANTVTFTAGSSGPVTLGVTVTTADGCAASSSTTIAVNPLPDATITPSGPTTFCDGGSVTLTAPAGMSHYYWSNGQTGPSITVSTSGTFHVTVTNANGCATQSANVVVTENAALPKPGVTASGATSFCSGGSVTLTATPSGGSGSYSFQWFDGASSIGGATSPSYTATTSGSYRVVVTDSLGCASTPSDAVAVTVNANPPATISAPAEICAGATGNASAADAGAGATYAWQISGGAIVSANGRNVSFTAGASGSVSLSVTVTTAAGCSATGNASIAINPSPAAAIAAPATICANAAGAASVADAGAGATYAWQISGGTITSSNGRNVSFTAGASGSVSLSVTVTTAAGCSATSSTPAIAINPLPSAAITAPSVLCANAAGTASVPDAGAGATYHWQVTGGTITSANGRNLSYTAGNGATMTISVTVTTASGCSTASSANVTVNAATVITTQPQSVTIARNTSTTLSVTASGTGTLTYRWYRGTSGNTSTPITGTAGAGSTLNTGRLGKGTYSYWVRVTGACGSVDSSTATVSVP